ncbi:MAG: hypothetical protein JNK97_12590 [Zoogloea sp.]|nr:hypothetical protein [Zoogloea sp.]
MALPWSTLVKAIPWSEVIARAPDLAQSARKLWQKAAPDTAAGSASQPPEGASPGDAPRFAALEGQLAEVSLRQQEGAELLAALAAQNAELVGTTHQLQQRVRQLAIALGVTGALALAALLLALLGGR